MAMTPHTKGALPVGLVFHRGTRNNRLSLGYIAKLKACKEEPPLSHEGRVFLLMFSCNSLLFFFFLQQSVLCRHWRAPVSAALTCMWLHTVIHACRQERPCHLYMVKQYFQWPLFTLLCLREFLKGFPQNHKAGALIPDLFPKLSESQHRCMFTTETFCDFVKQLKKKNKSEVARLSTLKALGSKKSLGKKIVIVWFNVFHFKRKWFSLEERA